MPGDQPFGEDPPRNDSLNFFEELDRIATDPRGPRFIVILMSGDHLLIEMSGQLAVLREMYIYYPADGGSLMVPFPHICAVKIIDDHT